MDEKDGISSDILLKIVQKVLKEFDEQDYFILIIRGQLQIEALLNVILESTSYNPDDLELDKMMFSKKIKLCIALGYIHEDCKGVLLKLASMRNKLAHEIWHKTSEKDIADFENTFNSSPTLRVKRKNSVEMNTKLGELLNATWLYLFEQTVRIAQSKKRLNDFWKEQIDISEPKSTAVNLNYFKIND